jgi:O-methyltransferase
MIVTTSPAPPSLLGQTNIERICAKARSAPLGAICEVGVYQGGSAYYLAEVARERGVELHLFDTFSGMPFADTIDSHKVGDFADTAEEAVRKAIPDAVMHVGTFPETFDAMRIGPVSFVHVDCDQYRSVRDTILAFMPVLVPGGVMVFDDWDLAGARQAIEELIPDGLTIGDGRPYYTKPTL